jgi:ADP-heptose:LPS heptosyltransferase
MIIRSNNFVIDKLQNIRLSVLKVYCKFVLPTSNLIGNNVLIFADMGIGNLVWYYPFLKSIESFDLTIASNNSEIIELLKFNIPTANVLKYNEIPDKKYDVVVANFLCQKNLEVYEIIKRKIPCRIGHAFARRLKYAWLFNHSFDMDLDRHETVSNLDLLIPFNVNKNYSFIKLPEREIHDSYDIVIQPHSSFAAIKDWQGYVELYKHLNDYKIAFVGSKKEKEFISTFFPKAINLAGKYDLIGTTHIIKNSKLTVGNDGGLTKITDGIGGKAIQIFRWWSDSYVIAKVLNGINLIEPSVEEVLFSIEICMK